MRRALFLPRGLGVHDSVRARVAGDGLGRSELPSRQRQRGLDRYFPPPRDAGRPEEGQVRKARFAGGGDRLGGSCPGCGGKGHSSPTEGAAHILGCGATTFPEIERHSPFTANDTRRILKNAVTTAAAGFKERITAENAERFAMALAEALKKELGIWCMKMEHQKFT